MLEACVKLRPDKSWRVVRRPCVLEGQLPVDGVAATLLPLDVYLWPDTRSYTRQPLAEIHTIGSPPILSGVVRAVCAAGARLAGPGEFTLRAFLAGRIDLPQAEAVLGLIDARGESDFQQSLVQLAGGLSRPLDRLRDTLLDLAAHLEAGLDFVEEDIQFITVEQVASALDNAIGVVEQAQAQLATRARYDALPRIVLTGLPNAGKSSLFNALAPGAAALVSDEPGTTRDFLSATVRCGPLDVQLVDTAGRTTAAAHDTIDAASQQQAVAQHSAADVSVLCIDASRPLDQWERDQLSVRGEYMLVVWTKCDRPRAFRAPQSVVATGTVETSSLDGRGIDDLRCRIGELAARALRATCGHSAERCGHYLRVAGERLTHAAVLNRTGAGEELIAAEVRLALAEIGMVVGTVYSEDILDRVFSRFCIGK